MTPPPPIPPPPPSLRGRVATRVESVFGALAAWSQRRAWTVLAVALLSASLALVFAKRLRVSADLAELLPQSFPSVQAVEKLKERVGGIGYVVVVARSEDPAKLERFAEAAAPELEKLEDVRYVDYRRPNEFFTDRALYFMDVSDLETIRDRLEARRRWEVQKQMPLYDLGLDEDAGEDEAPSIDFSDIQDAYEKRTSSSERLRAEDRYYRSQDKKFLAMFVRPDALSADLTFAREVGERVSQRARQIAAEHGITVEMTGAYIRKVEQQDIITKDLGVASSASLISILVFMALHLRRVRGVVFVMVPLLIGIAWTFAVAWAAFGVLNLMTSFLGAILLGLGIDHGIHLFARFQTEHRDGDTARSIRASFAETGRAVCIAALTTAVGFAALSLSEFRAFREFGVIAGVGMVLILAAYLVVGPALLAILVKRGRRLSIAAPPVARWTRVIVAQPKWVLAAVIAGCVVLALQAPKVSFNYDFEAIQGAHLRSFELDREVNRLLGRSQSPVIFLTESAEQEQALSDALRSAKREHGEATTIDFVLSLRDLVPPGQAEKAAVLSEIADIARRAEKFSLPDEQRKKLDQLRKAAEAKPFTRDDLPTAVLRQLADEQGHGVVLVFPSISQHQGLEVVRLAKELRSVTLPNGEHPEAAAEAMVLADVIDMVMAESPRVLAWTTFVMLIMLTVTIARIRSALLALGVGGLTIVLTVLALPPLGMSLNYLNIVVIPILFGLGVDGAVHLLSRTRTGMGIGEAVGDTARAIFGALFTTALGFGSLLLSDHAGLNSIGEVALIGLGINALLTLVALPALLVITRSRRRPAPLAG